MFGLVLVSLMIYRARSTYLSVYPPGCDIEAALVCEKNFLNCKLFTGPADDPKTLVRAFRLPQMLLYDCFISSAPAESSFMVIAFVELV